MNISNSMLRATRFLILCSLFLAPNSYSFDETYEEETSNVQQDMTACQNQTPTKLGTGITTPLLFKNCNNASYVFKKFVDYNTSATFIKTVSLRDSVANEVLAYLVDRFVLDERKEGLFNVPKTYPVHLEFSNVHVLGSAQEYVPKSWDLFHLYFGRYGLETDIESLFDVVLIFQILTLNGDPNPANTLRTVDNIFSIDNGLILIGAEDIDQIQRSHFFQEPFSEHKLPDKYRKFLSSMNLKKIKKRFNKAVEYLGNTFPGYSLNTEKRLLFYFSLALAKQFSQMDLRYERWFAMFQTQNAGQSCPFIRIFNKFVSLETKNKNVTEADKEIAWREVEEAFTQELSGS